MCSPCVEATHAANGAGPYNSVLLAVLTLRVRERGRSRLLHRQQTKLYRVRAPVGLRLHVSQDRTVPVVEAPDTGPAESWLPIFWWYWRCCTSNTFGDDHYDVGIRAYACTYARAIMLCALWPSAAVSCLGRVCRVTL